MRPRYSGVVLPISLLLRIHALAAFGRPAHQRSWPGAGFFVGVIQCSWKYSFKPDPLLPLRAGKLLLINA
jgi:hypothetical protein